MLAVQYLIVFTIIYVILFRFLNLEKKRNSWKLNIIIFIILAIIDIIRQIHYGYQPVRSYDRVIGFLPIFIVFLYKLGDFKSWHNWITVAISIFFGLFVNILSTVFIFNIFDFDISLLHYNGLYATIGAAFALPLFLLLYLASLFLKIRININAVSINEVLFIIIFIYAFGFFVTELFNFGNAENITGFLMNFLALVSGIMVIYFVLYLATQKNIINDIRNKEQQQELIHDEQEQHYKRIIAKDKEFVKFKHNITEEINFLKKILGDTEITADKARQEALLYITDMRDALTSAQQITGYDTGSIAASASWFSLINNDKYQNIKANWKGKIPNKICLSSRNQVLLFSNLLNNAFEAVVKSEKNRFVNVIVDSNEDDYFNVIIKNSYSGEIKKSVTGEFLTSKEDKKNHGIGMSIINKIVKENAGKIDFFINDNEFIVNLALPKIINI